jgi:hypothetical protein
MRRKKRKKKKMLLSRTLCRNFQADIMINESLSDNLLFSLSTPQHGDRHVRKSRRKFERKQMRPKMLWRNYVNRVQATWEEEMESRIDPEVFVDETPLFEDDRRMQMVRYIRQVRAGERWQLAEPGTTTFQREYDSLKACDPPDVNTGVYSDITDPEFGGEPGSVPSEFFDWVGEEDMEDVWLASSPEVGTPAQTHPVELPAMHAVAANFAGVRADGGARAYDWVYADDLLAGGGSGLFDAGVPLAIDITAAGDEVIDEIAGAGDGGFDDTLQAVADDEDHVVDDQYGGDPVEEENRKATLFDAFADEDGIPDVNQFDGVSNLFGDFDDYDQAELSRAASAQRPGKHGKKRGRQRRDIAVYLESTDLADALWAAEEGNIAKRDEFN